MLFHRHTQNGREALRLQDQSDRRLVMRALRDLLVEAGIIGKTQWPWQTSRGTAEPMMTEQPFPQRRAA